MLPQETIRKKRDGDTLTPEEITEFITGVTEGTVSEGQVAAFCMAVFFRKMNIDERVALTSAMARSGMTLEWDNQDLGGPVLDKHSTGGIGDKVSLLLAPAIAACGGFVPMISGRGLGHTGGTLDKMDAIPGYVSQPETPLLRKVTREVGCAIVGATGDIAPADQRIYAIRDVTATVENLDLITASILSKKLAAGLDGLVMDVKFGNGAFMQDYDDAKALAESIVKVANGAGMKTHALLTDMNQVLGHSAGNAVEVAEAVAFLKGEHKNRRLNDVTTELCATLLTLGGLHDDIESARSAVTHAFDSGKAAEYFARMVTALGGPADFMDKPDHYLATANVVREIYPDAPGIVTGMDTRALGIGIVEMGGGRTKPTDDVDHSVGLTQVAAIGDSVAPGGAPLATVHAASEADADRMATVLKARITLSETAAAKAAHDLVAERIAA